MIVMLFILTRIMVGVRGMFVGAIRVWIEDGFGVRVSVLFLVLCMVRVWVGVSMVCKVWVWFVKVIGVCFMVFWVLSGRDSFKV